MSIFSQIRVKKPRRTAFNLSHNYKMTGEMGVLYPILCQDVVPGDTFKLNSEIFCRLLPMIAPLMSRVRIYTHYFFVPKRLVWKGWEEFITGASQSKSRAEIDSFVSPSYPRLVFKTSACLPENTVPNGDPHWGLPFYNSELADYLGMPVFDRNDTDGRLAASYQGGANQNIVLDALPFRAYQLIWNEYYRDQNLMDERDIHYDVDGVIYDKDIILDHMFLRRRSWKKDYFTSALPFAQAGPDVTLPLTGLQDDETQLYVDYLPGYDAGFLGGSRMTKVLGRDGSVNANNFGLAANDGYLNNPNESSSARYVNLDVPRSAKGSSVIGVNNEQLKDLMSNIGSATINELRRAFAAQRFLESTARSGSRYIEQLYGIFGVRSSDSRLQRPEYLGGGVQDIVVSDVLQTSATEQTSTPQANQAGIGASLGRAGGFKRYFEEHGYVIGILSILPDASYQQGMPRQFMKYDRFDHYWPQFAHLGEQEIKPSELYYTGNADDEDYDREIAFGYTPRYAEYKYIPSTVHGDFRNSLSFWHLGRIFADRPNLNSEFIEAKPRKDVFAVDSNGDQPVHHFLFNIQQHLKAIRPMPRFGTPGI